MIEQWRDQMIGSAEQFGTELEGRGFSPVDDRTWIGAIHVPIETLGVVPRAFTIQLNDEFPFVPPTVTMSPAPTKLSWHMNILGDLCLYRPAEVAGRPWADVDELFARIVEWHDNALEGWPTDFSPGDLSAFFHRASSDLLVSYQQTTELAGIELEVERVNSNGWIRLTPGRPVSIPRNRDERRKRRKTNKPSSLWTYGVDIGYLTDPVWDWTTLASKLSSNDMEAIEAFVRERPANGILHVGYQRPQGNDVRAGAVALLVQGTANTDLRSSNAQHHPRLSAIPTADETPEMMTVRAGTDVGWLEGKHIAVIGCGAIGSHLTDLLARSGVNRFTLVDPDRLEPGNCVRHLAGMFYVPQFKVDAVASILCDTAGISEDDIDTHKASLSSELAFRLLAATDLVVDATANRNVHDLIEHVAQTLQTQAVVVALMRDGAVAQTRRIGHQIATQTAVPSIRDRAMDRRQLGCGDPISPAAPWSAATAAGLACRYCIDTLRSKRQRRLPDCVTDVLLPQPDEPFDQIGTVECRSI